MGMPVKLSDDLVEQAREEARAADRSITSQIEHWARLGRSVESALRHDDVLALKRADGDAEEAFPAHTTRRAVLAELRRIASSTRRSELAATLTRGRTVYQDDGAGRVERIDSNNRRTLGRFVGRRFVPDEQRGLARRK
jgi:hypothetical protein